MNQNLPRSAIIVFVVWFVLLYAFSRAPITDAPLTLQGLMLVWAVGGAAGVALAMGVGEFRRAFARRIESRRGDELRVFLIEKEGKEADSPSEKVGVVTPRPDEPAYSRAPMLTPWKPWHNPVHDRAWWTDYQARFPAHARLIDDVFAVMQTRRGMPAGIDFHVGQSLVQHSVDVMDHVLKVASSGWKFDGIRNSTGGVVVPNTDEKEVRFNGNPLLTPILPVAGFAHDIGKVKCMAKPDKGNKKWVMLPKHGEVGAGILRCIHSFDELPYEDKLALTIAVRYYHHRTDVPLAKWVGDRARALAQLLYDADCQSSYNVARDGGQPNAASQPPPATAPTSTPQQVAPETPAVEPGEPTYAGETTAGEVEVEAEQGPEETPEVYATASGVTPFDALTSILSGIKAVNGTSVSERVAWKYGPWVYVMLGSLLEKAGELIADKSLTSATDTGHPFVRTLLASLAAKGFLFLGEPARAATAAVWTATSSGNQGKEYRVLVIATTAVQRCAGTPDCPYPPLLTDADAGELGKMPEDAQKAIDSKKEPLTVGVLRVLAKESPESYGFKEARLKDGSTVYSFSYEGLREQFALDEASPPESVFVRENKNGEKRVLVRP